MLGLEKGAIKLSPHREEWHELFAVEARQLTAAIGKYTLAIEHIGSTAICGISAKPIIDIMLGMREIADVGQVIEPFEELGYIYCGENGITNRHYFRKGSPLRTHHLHIVELNCEFWNNHLLFRDYLRVHPQIAFQYENLKRELARTHRENREAYTEGKTAFIKNVLKAATQRRD
ncbi:MAG: GrpB family protein [Acidobacteriota bacterium]|nr:GrpB family protein [Acidobacteriota bacterium]